MRVPTRDKRRFDKPLLDPDLLEVATRDWARASGKRLQQLRLRYKWSQETLASASNVTAGTISKAELGLITPKPEVQLAIAHALMCEVTDIWAPIERERIWTIAGRVA